MKINKVINHNVITAVDENGSELVLMGKGIGFQKKAGEEIEDRKVEKRFLLENKGLYDKFQKLLNIIPADVIKLTDDLISAGRRELKKALNENIYISLSDHINMAMERFKKGHSISNGLLLETKRIYPKEFQLGLYAVEKINERFGLQLPEDEAGFIAMHFVNAQLNEEMHTVVNITKFMKEILKIVEYHFHIQLDENSLNYFRFVTHLKFFAQRIFNHATHPDKDKSLYEIVKKSYPDASDCADKISLLIENRYDYSMSIDEKLYLIIHIQKVIDRD